MNKDLVVPEAIKDALFEISKTLVLAAVLMTILIVARMVG